MGASGLPLSRERVKRQAENLTGATPERLLAWTIQTYEGRVALTCSFSGQGVVLAHMIDRIDRRVLCHPQGGAHAAGPAGSGCLDHLLAPGSVRQPERGR